jgi:predicted 2-oxoglutarate/Fe(II)-dependent dioxygenase YbiX
LIEAAEAQGFEAATIEGGRRMDPDIRNNWRTFIKDDNLADELWLRTQSLLPRKVKGWQIVGLYESIRFYRYENEQRFAPHYDGPTVRARDEKSFLTFMVYLNDDCEGGETVFFERDGTERFRVEPEAGAALVFDHAQFHEGAAVTRGRKYVLRTDVMYWRRDT